MTIHLYPDLRFEPSNNVLFNFYVKDIDEAYKFIKGNNIFIVKEHIGGFAYFNFNTKMVLYL